MSALPRCITCRSIAVLGSYFPMRFISLQGLTCHKLLLEHELNLLLKSLIQGWLAQSPTQTITPKQF